MNITWQLYGGSDFTTPSPPSQASPGLCTKYSTSPGADFVKVPLAMAGRDWRTAGGPGRRHDILVEVELDKVRMYTTYMRYISRYIF